MSRLVVAALVLLLTVGALLAAATWNQGGDAQAIVLSERELALPWDWPSDRAGARLRLQWQARSDPQDARAWLTDVKLREIGFTLGVPAGAPEAADVYGRSLPRLAWVAFELNGPAWRVIEQRRAMLADPGDPARHDPRLAPSRLVPVDAGLDPAPLRRRYANAPVVVLPAVIRMRYRTTPAEGPFVWGEVASLVSPDVTIPARLRGQLPPRGPADAHYEVDFRVGRLGAAWIEDVRRGSADE